MKKFIIVSLAVIFSLSLHASNTPNRHQKKGKSTYNRNLVAYIQKLLGPQPSLRMFTGQFCLPESLFARYHFAEVEEVGLLETTLSYKLETKAAHGIAQTSSSLTSTSNPYCVLSARTSLNIDGNPQEIFLAIRNNLSTRSLPLLHHSRDYALRNFDGKLLYDGTFEGIKELVSSLQGREPSIISAGAGPSSASDKQQIINEVKVEHIYAKSKKPHVIAFVTTTSKEALSGKVLNEAPKQTRYLFDINLTDGSAINIPSPETLTFEDMNVSSAYDPTGIWVAAASPVLHVLRLATDTLAFTADYTINISVPRLNSTPNIYLETKHPSSVIMRNGKPDYLETSSNGNNYISLLTGSKGSNTHFLVSRTSSLIAHQKQFFDQGFNRKVSILKTLPGSDFPVPFVEDLTTGIVSPLLTQRQLCSIGCDISSAFLMEEIRSYLPEMLPLDNDIVLITTKSAPKSRSFIFGNIEPQLKMQIQKIASLKGGVSVSPKLDAYVNVEKSAGTVPNSSVELSRKDGTLIGYALAMDAPVSPVDFCQFSCSYSKPIPGILLQGRRDTGIVFLHIHGGPHAKTSAYKFDAFSQYLASFGHVVDVNYPGSTGLGHAYKSYSDGNWSGVVDILAEIAMQFAIQGKKVVAVGTSFGAYATMKMADKYPDLLAGAIAINGIYDLHEGLSEEATMGDKTNAIEWSHQFGGSDGDETLNHNSVIFGSPLPLARVKCPTLLVSGGEDKTCLPAQTEKMFSVLAPSAIAYHLHSKDMGHSHNGADNVIITSIIGPFLHVYVNRDVIFEPFPQATARLVADGNDLAMCGLPGWSLKSNAPRRSEMLDAELTALGAIIH